MLSVVDPRLEFGPEPPPPGGPGFRGRGPPRRGGRAGGWAGFPPGPPPPDVMGAGPPLPPPPLLEHGTYMWDDQFSPEPPRGREFGPRRGLSPPPMMDALPPWRPPPPPRDFSPGRAYLATRGVRHLDELDDGEILYRSRGPPLLPPPPLDDLPPPPPRHRDPLFLDLGPRRPFLDDLGRSLYMEGSRGRAGTLPPLDPLRPRRRDVLLESDSLPPLGRDFDPVRRSYVRDVSGVFLHILHFFHTPKMYIFVAFVQHCKILGDIHDGVLVCRLHHGSVHLNTSS